MTSENPYAAPQVELFDKTLAQPLSGWRPAQLRRLAWLHLLQIPLTLVLLVIAALFANDKTWEPVQGWGGLASGLLACYLILRAKAFLEQRFQARGLFWPVWLIVVVSIALELFTLVMGNNVFETLTIWTAIYFAGVILLGLFSLWFGICLVRIRDAYTSVKVTGWLEIAGGVMFASILLLLVGMLPLLAAMVSQALMFFRSAREVEGSSAVA